MDKEIVKKLVLLHGKLDVEHNAHAWREIIGNTFNTLLIGALGYGGKGDAYTFKTFYELKQRAKDITIAKYLERQQENGNLNQVVNDLGYPQDFVKTLEGLIKLNKDYKLDEKIDLSKIDSDKFYNELKNVHGFGSEEGVILPWSVCDLVRLWKMEVPKNFKLSKRVVDVLSKLELSPNDFNVNDYPYVDVTVFKILH